MSGPDGFTGNMLPTTAEKELKLRQGKPAGKAGCTGDMTLVHDTCPMHCAAHGFAMPGAARDLLVFLTLRTNIPKAMYRSSSKRSSVD